MKILESRPERYDVGMGLLTLGTLTKIKQQIAEHTHLGDQVLDLGCGTGAYSKLMTNLGLEVIGVDKSKHMLNPLPIRHYSKYDKNHLTLR